MVTTNTTVDHLHRPRASFRDAFASQPRWLLILRGLAGIAFGLLAFLLPGVTFLMLIAMFAAYMLIDGAFALAAGAKAGREGERRWPFIVEGIANLGVGIIALGWPGATAIALIYLVAGWSIFTGVVLLFPGGDLGMGRRILIGLAGLCSILLGIAMALQPLAGSIALVWMIGGYGLAFGALMLVAGLGARRDVKPNALS